MSALFTPGPWSYGAWGVHADGLGKRAGKIADVSIAFKDSVTLFANGHLLAAAPELYEQVELFVAYIKYSIKITEKKGDDEGVRLQSFTLALAEAVLAKARGEQ